MNAGKQLIYYVIAPDPGGRLPRQLAQSLRSLRRFNPEIAVHFALRCAAKFLSRLRKIPSETK